MRQRDEPDAETAKQRFHKQGPQSISQDTHQILTSRLLKANGQTALQINHFEKPIKARVLRQQAFIDSKGFGGDGEQDRLITHQMARLENKRAKFDASNLLTIAGACPHGIAAAGETSF